MFLELTTTDELRVLLRVENVFSISEPNEIQAEKGIGCILYYDPSKEGVEIKDYYEDVTAAIAAVAVVVGSGRVVHHKPEGMTIANLEEQEIPIPTSLVRSILPPTNVGGDAEKT